MYTFKIVSLCELNSSKKNKTYYKVCLVDNSSNVITVFVSKDTYDKAKNLLYKDVSNSVKLVYDSKTCLYKPVLVL